MSDNLFDDNDVTPALSVEADAGTTHELSTRYTWAWGDALPDGLTDAQRMLWQIKRDMRALEETLAQWPNDVESHEFYRARIAKFRESLQKDGDRDKPQQIAQPPS